MSTPHRQSNKEQMNKINQLSLNWYFEQNVVINRFNLEGDVL